DDPFRVDIEITEPNTRIRIPVVDANYTIYYSDLHSEPDPLWEDRVWNTYHSADTADASESAVYSSYDAAATNSSVAQQLPYADQYRQHWFVDAGHLPKANRHLFTQTGQYSIVIRGDLRWLGDLLELEKFLSNDTSPRSGGAAAASRSTTTPSNAALLQVREEYLNFKRSIRALKSLGKHGSTLLPNLFQEAAFLQTLPVPAVFDRHWEN
ncbi:unnamed protein product, partial [Amoebophrya sp. A120]